jgi:hypothetical protein
LLREHGKGRHQQGDGCEQKSAGSLHHAGCLE